MTSRPVRCVDASEITTDDLIAHAHGAAPPAVISHIEHCPACQDQAVEYARVHASLGAGLYRRSCPETIAIGEYVLGLLPPVEALAVAEHIADCPHCTAERREFVAFLQERDEPDVSPSLMDTVRRLFARPVTPPAHALSGLRGAENGDGGVYTADGLHVTISVQRAAPGARGGMLAGLVEPWSGSSAGGRAHLYADNQLVQVQEVDEFGNFFFETVPPGRYRVEVSLPDVVVSIDPVSVS